jgi:hypothetical protein
MKGNRFLVVISLALSIALLPSALAVEKTSIKAAGPSPTTVVNTIRSGSGAPAKTLGINGDFYIDTKNLNLYGPKTKGVWKITTSLKAKSIPVDANVIVESGAKGDKGEKGATGDKGATGATGVQGIQGLTGPIGITGLAGTSGASGVSGGAGVPGVAGAKGETGAQGSQGSQGGSGSAGTPGVAGAKGDTGAQGIQGVKGDTGTTGAQGDSGASVVKFATVPLTKLRTDVDGGTSSSIFFTADSAGNYTFEILLSGLINSPDQMRLYAEITTGNMALGNQFAVASDSTSGVNEVSGRQYGFRVIGAVANVTFGTSFSVRVGIVSAADAIEIEFKGRALVTKVGSIG